MAGGVSKRMIDTQVRRGTLIRLRRGVYLSSAAWSDDAAEQHLILARAELAANPAAVLSHQSAALAWGLPWPTTAWSSQPISVTAPAGAGLSTAHLLATHHVADLPQHHLHRDQDGYLITNLARTAIDLASGLPLPEALVVLDAAARQLCESYVTQPRRSDYTNPKLVQAARAALERMAQERHRTGVLRAVTLTEPCRESAAESLSAGYFELAGIPRPEFQPPIATPFGTFFPDCWWPQHRPPLVGECDGAVKYVDPKAYVREKEREQVFRDLGYEVVRWLAREIMGQPAAVIDRVRRALNP